MNNRLLKSFALVTSSAFMVASCGGDNSSFETPNTSTTANAGIVAQKNLSILSEDAQPLVFDATAGTVTDTKLVITVKVGDRDNVLLSDAHTVFFATEWGLIEPSCTTSNGFCTVTWETSFGVINGASSVPADHLVTITAWTLGEENFTDLNGDGIFADPESVFDDREEPYIDFDTLDGGFNEAAGDKIIDVMDGNDLGQNGEHDFGDSFLNSPNCQHTSLCSTVTPTIYIWTDIVLDLDGPPPAPAVP